MAVHLASSNQFVPPLCFFVTLALMTIVEMEEYEKCGRLIDKKMYLDVYFKTC